MLNTQHGTLNGPCRSILSNISTPRLRIISTISITGQAQYGKIKINIVTCVGNAAHGGIYKPLQCGGAFTWPPGFMANKLAGAEISALIRGPLVYYTFERIHPFGDGNNGVSCLLEATVLSSAAFQYAPFTIGRY